MYSFMHALVHFLSIFEQRLRARHSAKQKRSSSFLHGGCILLERWIVRCSQTVTGAIEMRRGNVIVRQEVEETLSNLGGLPADSDTS